MSNSNKVKDGQEAKQDPDKMEFRASYYALQDSDKDEMEKLLLKWQDPDDDGLKVTIQDLHNWTLEELQTMCTLARDQYEMHYSRFGGIPKGFAVVEKPDAKTIKQVRELQKKYTELVKKREEEKKRHDEARSNVNENGQFNFDDVDDDLNSFDDTTVMTGGLQSITGKRSRTRFEDDDWILQEGGYNANNNNGNMNGNGFNGISRSIQNQTLKRTGRSNNNSNGNGSRKGIRNKTRRKVNNMHNHMQKVKQQLLKSGKFENIKKHVADGFTWYFRYNMNGHLIGKCEQRPDGFDSDDDVENPAFWADLVERPFTQFWKNEYNNNGERVYGNRVCVSPCFLLFLVYLVFLRFF